TVKRRFQQGVWNPKSTVPDTLLKPSLTGRGQFRLQRRRRRRRRQGHRPAHRRAGELRRNDHQRLLTGEPQVERIDLFAVRRDEYRGRLRESFQGVLEVDALAGSIKETNFLVVQGPADFA